MSKQSLKRVRRALKLPVNREPLETYAFPGGYPIAYLCRDGESLCAKCANDNIDLIDDAIKNDPRSDWNVLRAAINWESSNTYCINCNKQIECAYPAD